MKLQNYSLETVMDFDVSDVWTLVCENPIQFSQLTQEAYSQAKGLVGNWTLWGEKPLDFGKTVVYLADYNSVNITDKKSANLLMDVLKRLAFDENHTVATHQLLSEIYGYIHQLSLDVDFPTAVDDIDLTQLLKSVNISFLDDAENLFERLTDYVTLLSKLTVTKVLMCVNLRSYLTRNQLEMFYEHCMRCDINLVCLESYFKETIKGEKLFVCDEDLCEFFVNKIR